MSVTTASGSGPAGDAAAPEPRSRLQRLVHFYTSPGDRTPTWVGVAIALLAIAGLIVLGSTSQVWLLACAGLLLYAVVGVVRPIEAWRILRSPAEPSPRHPDRPRQELAATDEDSGSDQDSGTDASGWLPTRRPGRR